MPGLNEPEGISKISVLFTISFAALLAIGTLLMAFANFFLGAILFSLGIILIAGNEFLLFKRQSRARFSTPSEALSGLLNFAVAAYLFPATVALFLYFAYGWSERVLIVVVAGFVVTSVKLIARTAEFYYSK